MDKLTEARIFEDATYCCEQCFADTGIKVIHPHAALIKEAVPLLKASRIAADKLDMVSLSTSIDALLLKIGSAGS